MSNPTLLEQTTVRTYKNGSHMFSVEKSQIISRPDCATFRIEILESEKMLTPSEVPEKIVSREQLTAIIAEMSDDGAN